MKKRDYKHTMKKLVPGEWYYVDGYLFRYKSMGMEPEIDADDNWIKRTVVRHSGCFNLVGNFSPGGFFWKGETYGCEQIENFKTKFPKQFNIVEQYEHDQMLHDK
jgi:hypothetical protein